MTWRSVADLTVAEHRDVLFKLSLAQERLMSAENKTSIREIVALLQEAIDALNERQT